MFRWHLLFFAALLIAFAAQAALAQETTVAPAPSPDGQPTLSVEFLYWQGGTKKDQIKYTNHDFGGGLMKLQGTMGLTPDKNTVIGKLKFNPSEKSHIRFSSWSLSKEHTATVDKRIGFDDSTFYPGTLLRSRFDFFFFRAEYEYDKWQFQNKWVDTVSILFGLEYASVAGDLEEVSTGYDDKMTYGSTAPFLGFGLSGEITNGLTYDLNLSGTILKWESPNDRTSYHQVVSDVLLQFNYTTGRFQFNAGYYYYSFVIGNDLSIEQEKEFHTFSGGPFLGVSLLF